MTGTSQLAEDRGRFRILGSLESEAVAALGAVGMETALHAVTLTNLRNSFHLLETSLR